jgi:hypothetical protein
LLLDQPIPKKLLFHLQQHKVMQELALAWMEEAGADEVRTPR